MKQRIYQLSLLFTVVVLLASLLPQAATARPQAVTTPLYFDMVLDEVREKIYASDYDNGIIHIVSMSTLTDLSTLAVGSKPAGIDISPDGSELAVALAGQAEIAFVNLSTLTVSQRVTPNVDGGYNVPYDVVYGRTGRLYSTGNPSSFDLDYIHVFDTATKVELGRSTEVRRSAPRMAISADKNTLYVGESTEFPQNIRRFDITTDIPKQTAQGPHGPVTVNTLCLLPTGSVYSSSGQVWSGDLFTLQHTYPISGNQIECAPNTKRVFISRGNKVEVFDGETYNQVESYQLHWSVGVARVNLAETKLYVSTTNGIRAVPDNIKPVAYIPIVRNGEPGIYGRVTMNGVPMQGISVELRKFNGSEWWTERDEKTDVNGYYHFLDRQPLGINQRYYVRYYNSYDIPGQLRQWSTRVLTTYSYNASVAIGDFDIADIPLVAPANYLSVSLPVVFQWQPRPATPTDSYEFNLYGNGGTPYFFTDPPLGYTGSYRLEQLPPGFQRWTPYGWYVWVYSPDGGFGISYNYRVLSFGDSGADIHPDLFSGSFNVKQGIGFPGGKRIEWDLESR